METQSDYIPQWVLGNGKVHESRFCKSFLELYPVVYVEGSFFNTQGRVTDMARLRQQIYTLLMPYIHSGISKKVDAMLSALQLYAYRDRLEQGETEIPVANGTYDLYQGFAPKLTFCRCRLPVRYVADAPEPRRWLSFLQELLEEEDIDTLQEYMGYCLIPTTRGQKMLMLIGEGGEGKSRIGVVMKALLGGYLTTGSLSKLETSRFAVADLEHQLLFLDDDMQLEALTQTGHIKTIVTAELPMDIERKGLQSYQGKVHARLMAFGNGSLKALHDRSHGFFRRQIILTVKPRSPERVDDPFLADALLEEIEGIFRWCLEGLYRLHCRGYKFTISRRARENLRSAVSDGNNIVDFLESSGYIALAAGGRITSRSLYRQYQDWCEDNLLIPLSSKSFIGYLRQNQQRYGITYTTQIPAAAGKAARGFLGIRSCSGL